MCLSISVWSNSCNHTSQQLRKLSAKDHSMRAVCAGTSSNNRFVLHPSNNRDPNKGFFYGVNCLINRKIAVDNSFYDQKKLWTPVAAFIMFLYFYWVQNKASVFILQKSTIFCFLFNVSADNVEWLRSFFMR